MNLIVSSEHIKNKCPEPGSPVGAIGALAERLKAARRRHEAEPETMPYATTALLLAAMTGLFFGRGREYQADRAGAELCGRPLGLASRRSRRSPPARRASTTARPSATLPPLPSSSPTRCAPAA